MAPTQTVVAVAVTAAAVSHPDAELARNAAAALVRPHKTAEKIAEDLLERLQKVKHLRESRGLNHWGEFAPAYLQQLLTRHEARRRARIGEFLRAEHSTAVARAEALLGNRVDAEDAVSETFMELLEGRTSIPHFYHALKGNVLNRMEGLRNRAKQTASLERLVSPAVLSLEQVAWGPEGVDTLSLEPASHHPEDQDPLDILIAREERTQSRREVEAAMQDPRWRYIKRRDWAAGLEENVRN